MDDKIVSDTEYLYRAVKIRDELYLDAGRKPTSAMFKDDKGVSVIRDGGRDEQTVTKSFTDSKLWSKRLKALGKVYTAECKSFGAFIVEDPSTQDIHHSLIFGDEEKSPLSNIQSLKIARSCKIVYYDVTM